jgi:hypothetical protein
MPSSSSTEADWQPQQAVHTHDLSPYDHNKIEQYNSRWSSGSALVPTVPASEYHMANHPYHVHDIPQQQTPQMSFPIQTSPGFENGQAYESVQSWSEEDVDRILSSLQETLPDVGRLFDGSIGMF